MDRHFISLFKLRSGLSALLFLLLSSSGALYAQEFYYYGPNGVRVNLNTSHDRVLVQFNENTTPSQRSSASKKYALETVGDKSIISKKGLHFATVSGTARSKQGIQSLMDEIGKDPSVKYVHPFFEFADGSASTYSDEFIVMLRNRNDYDKLKQLADEYGAVIVKQNDFNENIYTLKVTKSANFDAIGVSNAFHESGLFAFTEPNFINVLPQSEIVEVDDPLHPLNWFLENNGPGLPRLEGAVADADVDGVEAWTLSTGEGIRVAIVDEGVDTDHPDLAANMAAEGFDPTDRAGLDGPLGNPTGDDAHGTACAGLVAAQANNGIGTAGLAYNSTIVPVRFAYGAGGGSLITTFEWIANSITWSATSIEEGGGGADVISNSWSGGAPSSLVDASFEFAITEGRGGKGSIVLFSAGNGNNSGVGEPADNDAVIAVGATTMCDTRKNPADCSDESFWGSTFGPGLDVAAPGVAVVSTDIAGANGYESDDYTYFNGTSSSCPITAATVALMLSVNPELTAAEARYLLEFSAEKVGGYDYFDNPAQPTSTWSNDLGYGRINAFEAVQDAIEAIDNPIMIVGFIAPVTEFCEDVPLEVTFTNTTVNAASFEWEFEGGTPAISTDENPTVTYNATGFYDVTLRAFDSNGNVKELKKEEFITVGDPLAFASPFPFTADFEGADLFPDDNWSISNPNGGITWESANVGAYGQSSTSLVIEQYFNSSTGDLDLLVLPAVDLNEVGSSLLVNFDYAYAPFSASFFDGLYVAYATDCGLDGFFVYEYFDGRDIATADPTSSPFVPSDDEWGTIGVDLMPLVNALKANGATSMTISLVAESGWSNNFYLDNVGILDEIEPVASFSVANPLGFCDGHQVQFVNESAFATEFMWEFPGGTPSTSTEANPVVTYSGEGIYSATLTAINSAGTDTYTLENAVEIAPTSTLPLSYDFEENLPAYWDILNPDNALTWELVTNTGAFGNSNGTGFVNNWNYTARGGEQDAILTPVIDVSGTESLALAFDYAYKYYPSSSLGSDGLEIYIATDDCNANTLEDFELVWSKFGSDLGGPQSFSFTPGITDWERVAIDLSSYLAGTDYVRIAIVNVNDFGNNLYLDNILVDTEILPRVNYFMVADAETDEFVTPINGDLNSLALPGENKRAAIIAMTHEGTTGLNSVSMELDGPVSRSTTENADPYSLFGDRNGGTDFKGRRLGSGAYSISATPYTERRAKGKMGDALSKSFNVVLESEVVDFMLVNTAGEMIGSMSSYPVMDMAELGEDISVVAITDPPIIGSVHFELSGERSHEQTESSAPYALFGDGETYNPWVEPRAGSYSLTATPYDFRRKRGEAGTPLTVNFEMIYGSPIDDLVVSGVKLVNTATGEVIGDVPDVINLAAVGSNLSIVAYSEGAGSVLFELSGDKEYERLESADPFALFGDEGENAIYSWPNIETGSYSLTITPYSQSDANGGVGIAKTITFEVVNQFVAASAGSRGISGLPSLSSSINLYPNPAVERVTVDFNQFNGEVSSVRIFDTVGKLHIEVKDMDGIENGKLDIPLGNLPAGIYIMRAETDGEPETIRFMKN